MLVCDGPHGLRKHIDSAIQAGFYEAVSTTCFPTSACMANSFDVALEEEVGDALGKDCQAEQIGILLGPGANLKRSPLCGRNFEYFSEDPYLSSHMADGYIRGLQQNGVGCCLKHFAANNQEYRRLNVSDVVDQRTLRELYLASFEYPIKHAKPWSIMCSYNRINGTYSSDNRWLLTDLLRKEWGYDGMVMSDWFAVNDRIAGIKAGLNLEMPGTDHDSNRQVELAVLEGKLTMEELDSVVLDTLKILARLPQWPEHATLPFESDHALARKAAAQSAVLLKNQDGVLPLWDNQKVAFIGAFAKTPRYQGRRQQPRQRPPRHQFLGSGPRPIRLSHLRLRLRSLQGRGRLSDPRRGGNRQARGHCGDLCGAAGTLRIRRLRPHSPKPSSLPEPADLPGSGSAAQHRGGAHGRQRYDPALAG